jgi:catabolite regulation protein CreA
VQRFSKKTEKRKNTMIEHDKKPQYKNESVEAFLARGKTIKVCKPAINAGSQVIKCRNDRTVFCFKENHLDRAIDKKNSKLNLHSFSTQFEENLKKIKIRKAGKNNE